MTDDHGDQFPGALPAAGVPDTAHRAAADERIVRMHADHTTESLLQADRDELGASLAEESAGARRTPGRRTPTRGEGGRRPEADTRLGRMRRITRSSLSRFDRYTLEVFNPGAPYGRSER
jgi:hypothetical protein